MALDRPPAHEWGAVTVIVAMLLPALIGVAGLVIDGGALMLSRLRLQTAADASALAAASYLGRTRTVGEPAAIVRHGGLETAARTIAYRNWPADTPLSLNLRTGRWDALSHRLVPSPHRPDAVLVQLGATIPTYLAGVMGIRQWTLSANSIATLPPLGAVPPGAVTLPIGLVHSSTSSSVGNRTTGLSSCLAALSFGAPSHFLSGEGTAPALYAGRSHVRAIGTIGALIGDDHGLRPHPPFFGDEVTTVVPVIEANRCPVLPGWYRVIGFATVSLRGSGPSLLSRGLSGYPMALVSFLRGGAISGSPIDVRLHRGYVASGQGGSGVDFGTLASSPVLVQ